MTSLLFSLKCGGQDGMECHWPELFLAGARPRASGQNWQSWGWGGGEQLELAALGSGDSWWLPIWH